MLKARAAILTGTGIYSIPGLDTEPTEVDTPYGKAILYSCPSRELVFLSRHGLSHSTPPHRINYRANFWALHQIGVQVVLTAYAVGSLTPDIPTRGVALLDDFLDFTSGRPQTFYEGNEMGVGHADMTRPYCTALGEALKARCPEHGLALHPRATYACTNGPRFESAAEVRLLKSSGGDVVGMTGVPEVVLARELGIHFAGVALSMNLAVGLEATLTVVHDLSEQRSRIVSLFLDVLEKFQEDDHTDCNCRHAVEFLQRPAAPIERAERRS
jgi:5'-methylthioadenosine phosphorylase